MIDVWYRPLNRSAEEIAALSLLLSDAERERAAAFLDTRAGRDFIVTRAELRRIVGPGVIETTGKPRLRDGGPEFNVSHAGDLATIAVGNLPVGVDVEPLAGPSRVGVGERFFHAEERRELATLPETLRARAFLHAWTAKEAVLKLCGRGIGFPLDAFRIEVDPSRPPALLDAGTLPLRSASLARLALPEGYLGVIATPTATEIRYRR